MSCLEEQEVTVVIELPEWHEFETWYESRTGQSSFMQLCRVINYLLGIYDRDLITFYRVGSNPGDTDFAAVNYEANATWNPLYDIQSILTECKQAVTDILNAEDPSSDCTIRMVTDRSSIIAIYNAAVAGLNLALKEDWLPLLTAMRNALEGISISTQTILAMDEAYLSISSSGSVTADNILKIRVGQNDPTCLTEIDGPGATIRWQVDYGGALEKNPYSARADSCGLEVEDTDFAMTTGKGVGAFFRKAGNDQTAGDGSYSWTNWSPSDLVAEGTPFCESLVGGDDGASPISAAGWVEQYELTTAFYVSRAAFSDNALEATDGLLVEWHIEKSNADIGCTFTPSSGSFNWGIGEEIKRIEVVTTLTDADLTDSEWPGTPATCLPVFVLDTETHTVCVNACGDYVNPS